jgi:hypothetical protein
LFGSSTVAAIAAKKVNQSRKPSAPKTTRAARKSGSTAALGSAGTAASKRRRIAKATVVGTT